MLNFEDLFSYSNENGSLIRKTKSGNKIKGSIAGCLNKSGYVQVRFNGSILYAHRIIWEMLNSPIPEGMQIDHINGNRSDNRIENLRLVSNQANSRNQKRKITNSSGFTGVSWDSQTEMWRAHITINGKTKCLGRFHDENQARNARKEADIKYSFHENHGR